MIRLKELRKSKNMTQQQLAAQLAVTQSALSGWENGKFEIDNSSLLKCSEIFQTSTDYILGITDVRDPFSPAAHSAPELTAEQKELLSAFDSLSLASKAKAAEYVSMLKTLDELQGGGNSIDMRKRA